MSSESTSETPTGNPDDHYAGGITSTGSSAGCSHEPRCPSHEATDRDAAHVVSAHPEQGWSLLCNGIVLFEDFGELLPNGECFGARRRELLMASPHRRSA